MLTYLNCYASTLNPIPDTYYLQISASNTVDLAGAQCMVNFWPVPYGSDGLFIKYRVTNLVKGTVYVYIKIRVAPVVLSCLLPRPVAQFSLISQQKSVEKNLSPCSPLVRFIHPLVWDRHTDRLFTVPLVACVKPASSSVPQYFGISLSPHLKADSQGFCS